MKQSYGSWMNSAGFLFAVITTISVLIGIHVGTYYDKEATGALLGAAYGFLLAVWVVIRPIWKDADKDADKDSDEDEDDRE